jgi:NAD(P)-dependent dehydrogenase (short-subunit alcohol dehydrogenase family)
LAEREPGDRATGVITNVSDDLHATHSIDSRHPDVTEARDLGLAVYPTREPPALRQLARSVRGELLAGQTVILTGAAGGIGRALGAVLAHAGARIGVVDCDGPGLQETVSSLTAVGANVLGGEFDVTDELACRDFHGQVEQQLGRVSGLINCAGTWSVADFRSLTTDEWDAMLAANLKTAVAACQAVLPSLIQRRSGAIVNFASTAGEYGSVRPSAHYAAATGAVISFTKSLAREVGRFQVRVNCISPGPTDTAALGAHTEEERRAISARTLFSRLGDPEEVAGAAVFLVSPLSTFVTGHVLRVNGGALL